MKTRKVENFKSDAFDNAQREALRRRMVITLEGSGSELAMIHCLRCGYGKEFGFDQVWRVYAAEPYGCLACAERDPRAFARAG